MNLTKLEFAIRAFALFFIMLHLLYGNCYSQTHTQYTESQEIIANPERGLQKYSITNNSYNTTSNFSNINQSTITGWRTGTDKVTVIFRYFLLDAYLTSNISQTYLDNMQIDFNRIRNAGLKCIVRFSYSNEQSSSAQQPSKSLILQHLNQLAPLLNANKDIILTHQAGLIGTWGEWYYTNSTEFGTDGSINSTQWQNRKEVIDAMLAATPAEIPIQVRYPAIKKTMYGSTQLNASTAYQNTPNARIGFFNDAFLNNWGDMGTYSVSSQNQNPVGTADYTYLSNETLYTPMTGETNGLNSPRTDGTNAVNELDLTNWSCLNRDYYTENFTNWINSGHYNTIVRNLGYRLVLENSTFQLSGNQLNVQIKLANKGNARLFKSRKAFLVLRNTGTQTNHQFELNTDPRTWESSVTINQVIDISGLPEGVYESYLSLPDPNVALSVRPEFSIRFSNDALWNANLGYNNLQQEVRIVTLKSGSYFEKYNVKVYPNPASSVLIFETQEVNKDYFISDQTGKMLLEFKSTGERTEVNISTLNAGTYLLHVKGEEQKDSIMFLVK
ncbi:MAG: DUF4832 domain-containing protein [Cytophagaceae bacterium]